MPRVVIDLNTPSGLTAVKGQWKFAQGLVPGEPNEGLVSACGSSKSSATRTGGRSQADSSATL